MGVNIHGDAGDTSPQKLYWWATMMFVPPEFGTYNLVYLTTLYAVYLWSPYVIGQTIYIFILFLSSFFFFARLISAVGDWMSTILRHMVWS